jgi:hypothetical protein
MSGAVIAGNHMTSVNEEKRAAKAARAVIRALSTTTVNSVSLVPLRHAYRHAVLNLSSEGPLNEARKEVGIALANLIHHPKAQDKIDKAKVAVEEWMQQLHAG